MKLGDRGRKPSGDLCCVFGKAPVCNSPQASVMNVTSAANRERGFPLHCHLLASPLVLKLLPGVPPIRFWPFGNARASLFWPGVAGFLALTCVTGDQAQIHPRAAYSLCFPSEPRSFCSLFPSWGTSSGFPEPRLLNLLEARGSEPYQQLLSRS